MKQTKRKKFNDRVCGPKEFHYAKSFKSQDDFKKVASNRKQLRENKGWNPV